MPAEHQNPLASRDGLAPNKPTGPTELRVLQGMQRRKALLLE